MNLLKLSIIVALGCLLHTESFVFQQDTTFHFGTEKGRCLHTTALERLWRTGITPPMTVGNSRQASTRRFYQSNDENTNANISIRSVRTGIHGKPALSSAEDIELTRQIIMSKWDIELTRQIIMGRMDVESVEIKVDLEVEPDMESNMDDYSNNRSDYHDVGPNIVVDSAVQSGAATNPNGINLDLLDSESNSKSRSKSNPVESVPPNTVRRASIRGVSISPSGFLVLVMVQVIARSNQNSNENELENMKENDNEGSKTHRITFPIRITSDAQDAFAATSAESLTMCQLLTGIDMAGAVLNPEVFRDIIGLFCSPDKDEYDAEEDTKESMDIIVEDELGLGSDVWRSPPDDTPLMNDEAAEELRLQSESCTRAYVRNFIENNLAEAYGVGSVLSYQEANMSQRSNIAFPTFSLDSVTIDLPQFDSDWTRMKNMEVWKSVVRKETQSLVDESSILEKNDSVKGNFSQNSLIPLPLQFVLECRIDGETLHIPLYNQIATIQRSHPHLYYKTDRTNYNMERCKEILQDVLYGYDDDCSGAFVALTLALRYKCPIGITSGAIEAVKEMQLQFDESARSEMSTRRRNGINSIGQSRSIMQVCMLQQIAFRSSSCESADSDSDGPEDNDGVENDDSEITSILPQYASTSSLHLQTKRVSQNIEHGFQLSKLHGALKIAIAKGDLRAETKIRNEIKKLTDNM